MKNMIKAFLRVLNEKGGYKKSVIASVWRFWEQPEHVALLYSSPIKTANIMVFSTITGFLFRAMYELVGGAVQIDHVAFVLQIQIYHWELS